MPQDEREDAERAFAVFDVIVDMDRAGRDARLAALALEDEPLARAVAELVQAHDDAGEFLEHTATAPFAASAPGRATDDGPGLERGALLGAWRVVQRLGTGGMGEVWEVERADGQFQQRAALKLLKRGLDSEAVLRRFRAERQILATLRHPAIAHVYDGGIAPDGRPFYVMEQVAGEPITIACDRAELGIEERLRVFLTVCGAVEAAHRSLVVHRDLKPSNVLMTAAGDVKLLDFGIAKVLEAGESAAAETRPSERLLTLSYAAPEQILGEPVTTATDVYSLGVVLYELLTGELPHRRHDLGTAVLAGEVDRETVERPSSAVRRGSTGPSPATIEPAERERRARRLRGDLDSIVLRALAREPERRYASAAALAADIRRHLGGQPVDARPDSVRYRAGKFARRHQLALAAAALVLASIVAGLAAALVQADRARRAAVRAERVRDFLVSVFESIDPERARGAHLTAREVVAEGARRFERELASEPEVQAELFGVLARAERSLGLYDDALARAREAQRRNAQLHGRDDPRTADAAATVAGVLADQGQLEAAERHAREALGTVDTGSADGELAAARLQSELGHALHQQWRLEEAEKVLRSVVDARQTHLGRRHPDTVASLLALANVLADAERFGEAEERFEELLGLATEVHGPAHPVVAAVEAGYATMLDTLKRFDEAEARYLAALEIRRRAYGSGAHVGIAQLHQMLGILYRRTQRLDAAETEATRALELYRRIDPGHYEIANSLGTLGMVAWARGDYGAARPRMREALDATIAAEGEDSFAAHVRRSNLAAVHAEVGDFDTAERLSAAAIAGHERQEQSASYMASSLVVHGAIARGAGRIEDALARHRRARAIRVETFGEGHAEVDGADVELAMDLVERGAPADLTEARRVLAPVLERCSRPAAHRERCETAVLTGARLEVHEHGPARAVTALRNAVERIAASRGEDHPVTAEARGYLGQALIASGSAAEGRRQLDRARRILTAARSARHPLVARLSRLPPAR